MNIGKVIVAAQHKDMAGELAGVHGADEADAVEDRHADICDDESGMLLFDEVQCFLTVFGIAGNDKAIFLPRNHLF